MLAKALESGWVETIYEDDEARLLKIRAEKGEPSDETKDEPPETTDEKNILDAEDSGDAGNLDANFDEDDEAN